MPIGAYTDLVMMRQGAYKSRIRQYEEERAKRAVSEARVQELETQVEESERRNLRLTRELMEETALRARFERQLSDAKEQLETLTAQPEGKQDEPGRPDKGTGKAAEGTKPGRKVSGGAQRSKRSPASKRGSAAKPVDGGSEESSKQPAKPRTSARKRGNVK